MDQDLKQYLTDMETHINGRMDQMETRIGEQMDLREARINERMDQMETRIGERMVETMRDMQTELLRGMASYSGSITLRIRKIEADQSNLDASLSGRVEILEKRLGEIEQRLGGITP